MPRIGGVATIRLIQPHEGIGRSEVKIPERKGSTTTGRSKAASHASTVSLSLDVDQPLQRRSVYTHSPVQVALYFINHFKSACKDVYKDPKKDLAAVQLIFELAKPYDKQAHMLMDSNFDVFLDAAYFGNLPLFKLLLKLAQSIDVDFEQNILLCIGEKAFTTAIKLEYPSVEYNDRHWDVAEHIWTQLTDEQCLRLLKSNNFKFFGLACQAGRLNFVNAIWELASRNKIDQEMLEAGGNDALYWASGKGQLDVIERLSEWMTTSQFENAMKFRDGSKSCAFSLATDWGHLKVAQRLWPQVPKNEKAEQLREAFYRSLHFFDHDNYRVPHYLLSLVNSNDERRALIVHDERYATIRDIGPNYGGVSARIYLTAAMLVYLNDADVVTLAAELRNEGRIQFHRDFQEALVRIPVKRFIDNVRGLRKFRDFGFIFNRIVVYQTYAVCLTCKNSFNSFSLGVNKEGVKNIIPFDIMMNVMSFLNGLHMESSKQEEVYEVSKDTSKDEELSLLALEEKTDGKKAKQEDEAEVKTATKPSQPRFTQDQLRLLILKPSQHPLQKSLQQRAIARVNCDYTILVYALMVLIPLSWYFFFKKFG